METAGGQLSRNIAVIVPDDMLQESAYFSQCLLGIAESVSRADFDVITAVTTLYGVDRLQKILEEGKADGVILMRVVQNDSNVAMLQRRGVPFVEIGSSGQEQQKTSRFLVMTGRSSAHTTVISIQMTTEHMIKGSPFF